MTKIFFLCKPYYLPQNLSEITADQYRKILPCLQDIFLSIAEKKAFCISALLNLDKNIKLKFHIFNEISEENLLKLMESVDFLFDESQKNINVFKKLKIGKNTFYSVADDLENMTVGEFIFAENNLRQAQETKNSNHFIACIYRKADKSKNPKSANFDGDLRERFNDNLLENQSRNFQKLSPYIKRAIADFFVCASNNLRLLYKEVFPKNGETAGSWLEVVASISEKPSEIKVNLEENLHNFLLFLNQKMLDQPKNDAGNL